MNFEDPALTPYIWNSTPTLIATEYWAMPFALDNGVDPEQFEHSSLTSIQEEALAAAATASRNWRHYLDIVDTESTETGSALFDDKSSSDQPNHPIAICNTSTKDFDESCSDLTHSAALRL